MHTITKIEVDWIVEALKMTSGYYRIHSKRTSQIEASLAILRAEQLEAIMEKLEKAVKDKNKRIAIEY
ncbi:hypothetical protein D5272_01635 [bacterium D16-76]|nr:hypothetical protein [bacterium D16-76]